ncbi:hypothetical protein [Pseudomonas sp. B392_1p]|uniref:hypothetical protein n=1 Tax=Pseudomonas sp. B392_1p TaxID=3457507 RepID=UPI003FD4B2B1
MPTHAINRPARWILGVIAVALSSVTALSVAMALFALIADPLLAVVFAGAAVLLDAYKYLAWPIALGLFAAGKQLSAVLMITSALVLGAVSAWATYDRLLTSIMTGQARHAAINEQRIADLQVMRADALQQLDALDAEARSVGEQARQLRERVVVTKAQEWEAAAQARIDNRRDNTLQRLDAVSVELTELRSRPAASAGLPAFMAIVLCAGFAFALEMVPALIGSALRFGSLSRVSATATTAATAVATTAPPTATTDTTTATAAPATAAATDEQRALPSPTDSALLETLRDIARAVPSGSPVSLRDFTAAARVGNRRAMKLFAAAIEQGELRKTTTGYVTA